MGVSRRAFLRFAACVPIAGAGQVAANGSGVTASDKTGALLVNSSCLLRESFEGYKACVAAAGMKYAVGPPGCSVDASLVLAPAAALTSVSEARSLRRRAESGALVLVESGAMFLSPAEVLRHQSVTQSVFGLTALSPLELWTQPVHRFPYVDFTWPVLARVRDFSRLAQLVPLTADRHGEERAAAIAHIGSAVAAVKICTGDGILIFLGSPLGPHLLAGDREALSWFGVLAALAPPHGADASRAIKGGRPSFA